MLDSETVKKLLRTVEVTNQLLNLEKHYAGKDKTVFQLILVGLAETAHGTLEAVNNNMDEVTIFYHWETHIKYIHRLTDFIITNRPDFVNAMIEAGLSDEDLLINKREESNA